MTELFLKVFGRLPIGWFQLKHNRTRFASAIAGVAFANILIFMQLGFLGALKETIKKPYELFNADILISPSDANTLSDGGRVPRVRLYQALSIKEVKRVAPLYLAKVDWNPKDEDPITFHVFGISLDPSFIRDRAIFSQLQPLSLLDYALIDSHSRGLDKSAFEDLSIEHPKSIEINGRELEVIGNFEVGGGFLADGYLVVSDQTFASLVPGGILNTPKHILVQVENPALITQTIEKLQTLFRSNDSIVRSYKKAMEDDQKYQTTKRPVGVVFGFGTFIGILVGIVIVYQVLSSDVADHLKEYATFKAIGYAPMFFNSIILEEAIILAVAGFIPGVLIALGLYHIVGNVTGLPLAMNGLRLLAVLVGTTFMCLLSGLLASRKLHHANPADLF